MSTTDRWQRTLTEAPEGYGIRYDQCRHPGCSEPPTANDVCSDHARRRGSIDLDEFMWLINTGEHPSQAAHRLGVTLKGIERAARRNGRDDVLAYVRTEVQP